MNVDELPAVHPRERENDPLKADNNRKAVLVTKYNDRLMAIGDEAKGEWLYMK